MMTGAGPAVAISESSPPHWGKDLLEGVRETWRARDLIHQLTVRDIRVRYKEAVMGVAWAIVMPAAPLIAFKPRVPSVPVPESTIPMAFSF